MSPNFYDSALKELRHPFPNAVRIIIRIRNEYDIVSLACSDCDPIPYHGFLVGRVYDSIEEVGRVRYQREDWKIACEDDPTRSLTIAFKKRFPIISNTLTETDLLLLSIA